MSKYKTNDIVKLTNGQTGKIFSVADDGYTVSYQFMPDGCKVAKLVEDQDIDPTFSYIQYFDPTFVPEK